MATSAQPSIAKIVHGPKFIGMVVNAIFYGISITQTYFYYTSFKNDRMWIKLFILVIFVADTVNSVFDIQYMYSSLVNNYNKSVAIQKANWVFATDPAMTSIVGTMVQLFFSWRVKVWTNNTPMVCLLVFGSIISGLGGIVTSIFIGVAPEWLEFQKFEAPVIVWLTTSAAVDTTITVFLVVYLRQHKTGFMGSDDVMNKILRLTVQTGLITSMWAIVDLGVYLGISTGLHLAFNFPLSKLYSNSLLSSLNSRRDWKFSTTSDSDQKSPMHVATSAANFLRNMQHPDQIVSVNRSTVRPEVYIDVESHEMRDTVEKKTRLDVPEDHDCKDVQKPNSDPAAMVQFHNMLLRPSVQCVDILTF